MVITIDGPTASGKSSVARRLANRMFALYVYSGLLYRAIAYVLAYHRHYTDDTIHHASCDDVDWCIDILTYTYVPETGAHVYVDEHDITPHLKTSHVDTLASIVSMNAYVRHGVNMLQHRLAHKHTVVIDGRDAGTVVFPRADIKLYMTAAEYIRAMRWRSDQIARGHRYGLLESFRILRNRDMRDQSRDVSPLHQASDAYFIDNSQLDVYQTVKLVSMIIHFAA